VKIMSSNDGNRDLRKGLLIASTMVGAWLVISGPSLAEIAVRNPQMAQATQSLQSTPGAETKPSAPAEPATTGTRPAELSPQPAHPDARAQKEGVTPALPPAPAEKTAPPIKERVHEK
jgi:hypothetical protein